MPSNMTYNFLSYRGHIIHIYQVQGPAERDSTHSCRETSNLLLQSIQQETCRLVYQQVVPWQRGKHTGSHSRSFLGSCPHPMKHFKLRESRNHPDSRKAQHCATNQKHKERLWETAHDLFLRVTAESMMMRKQAGRVLDRSWRAPKVRSIGFQTPRAS